MKSRSQKSWLSKLHDNKGFPKISKITGDDMTRKWGTGTMVIPAPIEVDEVMRRVPKGKVTTINDIRMVLAKKHNVDVCCPLTAGIFAWIAAHAAEESRENGQKRITPYWRTLKTGGFLNEKYPGGIERQKKLLESEGHQVVSKGKRYMIASLVHPKTRKAS